MSCFSKRRNQLLKVNRVSALREFGVTGLGAGASGRVRLWPASGRAVSGSRSAGAWSGGASRRGQGGGGALRGAEAAGLWVPGAPQPRTPGPSRSAHARPQVPRLRPVRLPETSRDGRLALLGLVPGSAPSDLGHSAFSRASAKSPSRQRVPSRGWESGCTPFPRPGAREQGAGRRGRGAGSSLPGGPPPACSLQLLPRPRRRPSPRPARRPTRSPEAGNCRPPAPCPDGTVAAGPTPPTIASRWGQTPAPPRSSSEPGHVRSEILAGRETTSRSRVLGQSGGGERSQTGLPALSPAREGAPRPHDNADTPPPRIPAGQRPPRSSPGDRGRCPHSDRAGSSRPVPVRGARSWGPRRPGRCPPRVAVGWPARGGRHGPTRIGCFPVTSRGSEKSASVSASRSHSAGSCGRSRGRPSAPRPRPRPAARPPAPPAGPWGRPPVPPSVRCEGSGAEVSGK